MTDLFDATTDAPAAPGNRATRRAAARRGRKLAAIGSGAVLATGVLSGALAAFPQAAGAATTITVTNTDDAGAGSLRQALADANTGDTIDLTGLSGTITLTSGQLVIEDAITISGPGASTLAISGNNASRVFSMDQDLAGGTVTISGLTITGGNDEEGGGVFFNCEDGSGSLVVESSVVTGNTSDDLGGGLYFDACDAGGTMTVSNSVVSNNTSTGDEAGGIWFDEGDSLTIENSTISGNHAEDGDGGGVLFDDGGDLTVLNSTFAGNTTTNGGGGIAAHDPTGTVLIANSTFNGNTAVAGGGILLSNGNLTLAQTTISGNTASDTGDGLYFGYSGEKSVASDHQGVDAQGPTAADVGTVTITGAIVAGNDDGTDDIAADPEAGVAATIASSVIGTVNGVTVTDGGGNQNGVSVPGLAPLADNGGATQTMALLTGSPAIDKGPNPVASFPGNEFDQRGDGFARVVGSSVDVGAFEVQTPEAAPLVITPRFTG
jgi:hypothetical protein